MTKKHPIIIFSLFILFTFTQCESSSKYHFSGKWQSLNDAQTVIEISKNGDYQLFRNKELFFVSQKISILPLKDNWYSFNLKNKEGEEFSSNGRIEVVDENRIRIYHHKHHDILNVADEYHRTDDFGQMRKIMDNFPTTHK